MTNEIRQIVNGIVNANRHEWWELKREIFDAGESEQAIYVFYYPRVKRVLDKLPETLLRRISGTFDHPQDKHSVDAMRRQCFEIIIKEILRRAKIAARKTHDW